MKRLVILLLLTVYACSTSTNEEQDTTKLTKEPKSLLDSIREKVFNSSTDSISANTPKPALDTFYNQASDLYLPNLQLKDISPKEVLALQEVRSDGIKKVPKTIQRKILPLKNDDVEIYCRSIFSIKKNDQITFCPCYLIAEGGTQFLLFTYHANGRFIDQQHFKGYDKINKNQLLKQYSFFNFMSKDVFCIHGISPPKTGNEMPLIEDAINHDFWDIDKNGKFKFLYRIKGKLKRY